MTQPMTLINGKQLDQLKVDDRGIQYGDGLFETITIKNASPVLWDRHLARLDRGCDRLKMPKPDKQVLFREVKSLCDGIDRGVLKLIYTRGNGERGYQSPSDSEPTRVLQRFPWPALDEKNRTQGVKMRVCETRMGHNPLLAGLKHLNRLEQVMARSEWQNYNEIFEGVMTDQQGHVIEATMCNLFCVLNDVLVTPELSQCGVQGVIRDQILDNADQLLIDTRVGILSTEELRGASEVFLTNSLIGVWPVNEIEDVQYNVGPVTNKIANYIESVV